MKGVSKRKLFEMILITNVLKFIAFTMHNFFLTFSHINVIEKGFTIDFLKIIFLKGYLDDLTLT